MVYGGWISHFSLCCDKMPNKQIKEGGVDFSSFLQGTVVGGEDLVAGSGVTDHFVSAIGKQKTVNGNAQLGFAFLDSEPIPRNTATQIRGRSSYLD